MKRLPAEVLRIGALRRARRGSTVVLVQHGLPQRLARMETQGCRTDVAIARARAGRNLLFPRELDPRATH